MKEKKSIQFFILIYWTFFAALNVIDKIVPAVNPFWVGTDYYTLFVKFFASLGISNPKFATTALAFVSIIEILAFGCYLFSLVNHLKDRSKNAEQWFYRGISFSLVLFSLFSIGDQIFGDRFNLLEHGIFWIILVVSWVIFKYNSLTEERILDLSTSKGLKVALLIGSVLTFITCYAIVDHSKSTFANKTLALNGEEIIDGVYKFNFPFLGDKFVLENTLKTFKETHKDLEITYVYTGPDELNSKKKTHMLLYVFTEPVMKKIK
jgi:hypothetical protein